MDLGPGMSYVFTDEWHAGIKANSARRDQLCAEADSGASWRGHDLFWYNMDLNRAHGQCRKCGMHVVINTEPPPNGIHICGQAIALDCPEPAGPGSGG